jgi:uncharacterized surface protein with fasciclin (FAS1) repeats
MKNIVNRKSANLFLLLVCCWTQSLADDKSVDVSLAEYLNSVDNASIFVNALRASTHWGLIEKADSVAVFMPDNDSLRNEGSAFLLEVVLLKPENRSRLNQVTGLHIANGVTIQRSGDNPNAILTASGDCVTVASIGNAVKVGPESMLVSSVAVDNGEVHSVDRLLWAPFDVQSSSQSGSQVEAESDQQVVIGCEL